jgi:hypothetical protein
MALSTILASEALHPWGVSISFARDFTVGCSSIKTKQAVSSLAQSTNIEDHLNANSTFS